MLPTVVGGARGAGGRFRRGDGGGGGSGLGAAVMALALAWLACAALRPLLRSYVEHQYRQIKREAAVASLARLRARDTGREGAPAVRKSWADLQALLAAAPGRNVAEASVALLDRARRSLEESLAASRRGAGGEEWALWGLALEEVVPKIEPAKAKAAEPGPEPRVVLPHLSFDGDQVRVEDLGAPEHAQKVLEKAERIRASKGPDAPTPVKALFTDFKPVKSRPPAPPPEPAVAEPGPRVKTRTSSSYLSAAVDPAAGTLDLSFKDLASGGGAFKTLTLPAIVADGHVLTDLQAEPSQRQKFNWHDKVRLWVEDVTPRAVAFQLESVVRRPKKFRIVVPDDCDWYEGGERFNGINQRGNELPMFSVDATGNDPKRSYKPVSFMMCSSGYGVWADSYAKGTFDLRERPGSLVLTYPVEALRVVFFAGPSFQNILSEFTKLSGRPHMPPDWAFAPWKGRDVHRNSAEVLEDVRKLRELKIPGSVLLVDSPWETGYNDFNMNTEQFEDPHATFAEVKRQGFKLALWFTPFVNMKNTVDMRGIKPWASQNFQEAADKGYLVKARGDTGRPQIVSWWKGSGGRVDFTNPDAVNWWQMQLNTTAQWGAAAFKADDGEGAWFQPGATFHDGAQLGEMFNKYTLKYQEANLDYIEKALGGDGVLMSRSSYTGGGKSFVWAGDNDATFSKENGMASVILAGQTAALSGIFLWGHDIGGYLGTASLDVFLRWTAFGALSPLMHQFSNSNFGPWDYGEEGVRVYRAYAKLHTQLFPYLRDAAAAAAAQGEPIVSPMVLAHQADPAAAAHDFQYMLGPCLLVAPVYQAGATAWPVYLPKGHAWVDFWTGAAHEGGRTVEVAAPLDRIPLLVRSGCLLELVPEDVETLLPASAELAPGVKPLGPERVLQVWGHAADVDHALENPDLRAKVSHLETGDSILEVELHGAAPYALELQIMHADVSDVTVDSSTQGKVRARCARVAAADDYLGRPHTSCQLPEEPGNLLVQWKRRPGGGEAGG